MHELRSLHKEHVGRTRSLRFFERVRDFQSAKPTGVIEAHTPEGLAPTRIADAAVLSCCGHVGQASWLRQLAERQECAAVGCAAAVRDTSIVRATELHGQSESVGGSFGCKLSAIVEKVAANRWRSHATARVHTLARANRMRTRALTRARARAGRCVRSRRRSASLSSCSSPI
jgi:hypothetical protein